MTKTGSTQPNRIAWKPQYDQLAREFEAHRELTDKLLLEHRAQRAELERELDHYRSRLARHQNELQLARFEGRREALEVLSGAPVPPLDRMALRQPFNAPFEVTHPADGSLRFRAATPEEIEVMNAQRAERVRKAMASVDAHATGEMEPMPHPFDEPPLPMNDEPLHREKGERG